ncbi:MAG: biotin--[acetyl-CoA-carboxylase] ligase [Betaproteobacteria bacterium]|nr:biotin--[acetyl-CoA-carboxylase] ligase [Betaproteobacteria bacterium]
MPGDRLRWPAEAVWEAVAPLLPGFTVEVLPEIASTNTELMRRCRAGQTDPVLLVAEHQSAGRGRLGRHWHTPPGTALTFSLGLVLQPADWGGLSLAVGTSLAESLGRASGADIRIKWPNDLWLHDCKLAGILIETAGAGVVPASPGLSRYVIIGVGINVCAPEGEWAPPPSGQTLAVRPPAWLQDASAALDAPATLSAVAAPLVTDVLRFQAQGFAAFTERFARCDRLAGREVELSDGRTGRGVGVSATGALRLEVAGVVQDVLSGDVSVRPLDP